MSKKKINPKCLILSYQNRVMACTLLAKNFIKLLKPVTGLLMLQFYGCRQMRNMVKLLLYELELYWMSNYWSLGYLPNLNPEDVEFLMMIINKTGGYMSDNC